MITAINIALLAVVLAAVALVIVRRRRSGAGDEVVSEESPEETPSPVAGPAATDDEEASIVSLRDRVDRGRGHADAGPRGPGGGGLAGRDRGSGRGDDTDDGAGDGTEDPDAAEGDPGQDTGEIQGLELEATTDPDDGLGGIITEPGWYLPGEVNMSWEDPSSEAGLLVAGTS